MFGLNFTLFIALKLTLRSSQCPHSLGFIVLFLQTNLLKVIPLASIPQPKKMCISIGLQIVLSVKLYVHAQTHTAVSGPVSAVWLLQRIGLLPALPLHPSMENNHKNRKRSIQGRCPMKGPAVRVRWRLPPLTGGLAGNYRVEQEAVGRWKVSALSNS